MKRHPIFVFLLLLSFSVPAEEGMWMLQSLKQIEPQMKALGLEMNADEIYHPDNASLTDAIVIFGPGCTGEIISGEGLVATNHHCGHSGIHAISTLENNYLETGFWANNRNEEIPVPGLDVTFIEKMEDITAFVLQEIENDPLLNQEDLFDPYTLDQLVYRYTDLDFSLNNPDITLEISSFYSGNQFYLLHKKKYPDVRLVGTPPSSIGKFGGETDNWKWPRHTGDFALFRIYADSLGNPAEYKSTNIPLNPKTYIPVSTQGFQENDFAFVVGFPGITNRYMTSFETIEEKNYINPVLIRVRGTLLNTLDELMSANHEVKLQYADKYNKSANYYKNAIGVNQSLEKLNVIKRKENEENEYRNWTKTNNYPVYIEALDSIKSKIKRRAATIKAIAAFHEICYQGMEFTQVNIEPDSLITAIKKKDELLTEIRLINLQSKINEFFDNNYNPDVDKAIAKKTLPLLPEFVEKNYLPDFFDIVQSDYNGSFEEYLDTCFTTSIFGSRENFRKFRVAPNATRLESDMILKTINSIDSAYIKLLGDYYINEYDCEKYMQTFVSGILLMQHDTIIYPDANSTMRLSYGTVKSHNPSDAVKYDYYTTLKGVMEKEDETDKDFQVPEKLKELYEKNTGETIPVCFITTNDITGGNSGSPVMNKNGELIGIAFDGNWEAMSSDYIYEPELQRCITVDIRYMLFIIDKFAENKYILHEILQPDNSYKSNQ